MRLAAIDIGSNAARLLISDATTNEQGKTQFQKLNLVRVPLRLGFDVFEDNTISKEREDMMISDPTITVTCDSCGDAEEFGLTSLTGGAYDERNLAGQMAKSGWTKKGSEDICATCTEESANEELEERT